MGFFKWLYNMPGRVSRSMETTALASSIDTPGAGSQANSVGVKTGLGKIEENTPGDTEETDQ